MTFDCDSCLLNFCFVSVKVSACKRYLMAAYHEMNHRYLDQYVSVNGAPDRVFVSHQSHLFPDGESNLT